MKHGKLNVHCKKLQNAKFNFEAIWESNQTFAQSKQQTLQLIMFIAQGFMPMKMISNALI